MAIKVRGKAVDAETGEPIHFARVEVIDPKTGKTIDVTATDAEGRFVIEVPEPGEYEVVLKAQVYQPVSQRVTIEPGVSLTIRSVKVVV